MRVNRSTDRTIEIIKYIAAKPKPSTLGEISRNLDIPKTSTLEILNTLVQKNVLEMEGTEFKTYQLGWTLLEMSISVLSKVDLLGVARPLMGELSSQIGESVFLAVEDQGEMVYLEKVEGTSMVRTTVALGSRAPIHSGALGKAFLAALPDPKVLEITNGGNLVSYTQNTITNHDDLIKDLEMTRERGYAIDNQEYVLDLYCVGAPIYNQTNQPIAAISIPTQAHKRDSERISKFTKLLTATALLVSKRLGYTGQRLY